ARVGAAARVHALCGESTAEAAIARPREGRAALRCAARALVSSGAEERAYDLYARHLVATNDEGSRKDADWLLGDAVRRADDLLADQDEPAALAGLDRALAFATAAGLDARAHAKIDRKVGRAHQLAGRFPDATTRYRAALSRLDATDRYRSVLHGDLALASLGVRGTLDLLPTEARGNVEEAERLLAEGSSQGEGESYNAIYTLGVLAYERGDHGDRGGRGERGGRRGRGRGRFERGVERPAAPDRMGRYQEARGGAPRGGIPAPSPDGRGAASDPVRCLEIAREALESDAH